MLIPQAPRRNSIGNIYMRTDSRGTEQKAEPRTVDVTVSATLLVLAQVLFLLFGAPRFAEVFEGFEAPLPLATRLDFALSHLVRQHLIVVVVVLGIAILLLAKGYELIYRIRGRRAALQVLWVTGCVLVLSLVFVCFSVFLPLL
jgi:type II secretory pathway component PulF